MATRKPISTSILPKDRQQRRPLSPTIRVTVTREDIQDSIRRTSTHCMIKEAVARAAPGMINITVDMVTIRFTDPAKRLRFLYITPLAARIALINYDQGIEPAPFSFRLKTAAQITRVGGRTSSGLRTPQENKERRAKQDAERHQIRKKVHARQADKAFTAPDEERERVIRAMKDPTAPLGPAIALTPSRGNKASLSVVVGGSAPPHIPGQLWKTRRFGMRAFVE